MNSYGGNDYSGPGSSVNRNIETGIRYGIISARELTEWLWNEVDTIYLPYCPHCDEQLDEDWDDVEKQAEVLAEFELDEDELVDPVCPRCGKEIEDGDQWPEEAEPDGNIIDADDCRGFVDDDNDVWCTESPYYTWARFCSPCAPGACSLSCPTEPGTGGKAYCWDKSWFEKEKCPYPYWSVETDELLYEPEPEPEPEPEEDDPEPDVKYVPEIGDRVKLRRFDNYSLKNLPIWAWLRVEAIDEDDYVTVRVLEPHRDGMQLTLETCKVTLETIEPPLGWRKRYTVYVYAHSGGGAEKIRNWLESRGGVAVWASVNLRSPATMMYSPADKGTEKPPHWSMTYVETVTDPNRIKIVEEA